MFPDAHPLDARLRALADEAAADAGLFVVDLVVRGRPGGRVVEVFADSEAGAGHDDLAALSRRLAFLLDAEDPIDGRYRLDVSTPGLGQPLRDPRQYRRHIGRSLRVQPAEADAAPVEGTLDAVDDEGLVLSLADGSSVRLAWDAVGEARVLLPW